MPPLHKKNKEDFNNYYHDRNSGNFDRERGSGNFYSKRVSFKAQSHPIGWVNKIIECFEQGGNGNKTPVPERKRVAIRYNPIQGRRGAHRDANSRNVGGNQHCFRGRVLQESPFQWYKVTLCNGKKYSRLEILKALQNFIDPMDFIPIAVNLDEDDLTFFIDNYKAATAICAANLRFSMRDGWKIQIKVSAHMPYIDVNPALKEKIREVMSANYDEKTQHLDLCRFYSKEGFQNNGIFAPLNCQNVFQTVLEIIGESVPNIVSLDLSHNKIISTEHLSILKKFGSRLKSLSLSHNKINNLRDLLCLQGMKIETLALDGNPLCDKYEDQTNYVREVRKIFKAVIFLDAIELPPPLSFDEESVIEIPKSLGSFLCDINGKDFTQQFLAQFYALYDDRHNRDALNNAYADSAQFSMNVFNISGTNSQKYVFHSRNLKKVNKFEHITKLLHWGRDEIVRFLNTLPKTQHDLSNMTVDLLIYTPQMISLCVCGVFYEIESTSPIRAFSRTFILTPTVSGYNIISDMLSITDASKEVATNALSSPVLALAASPQHLELNVQAEITPCSPIGESTPIRSSQELDEKRRMINSLSEQTGMNLKWSEKCLLETDWNLNNALFAFNKFHKSNQIPPEAFMK